MIDFHTLPVLIQEFAAKYPNYERVARQVFNIAWATTGQRGQPSCHKTLQLRR